MMRDIFERERAGEWISTGDPEYGKIHALIREAQQITAELNTGYHDAEEVRDLFSRLTGTVVPASFRMNLPFHTDYGKGIRMGENVFINFGCIFMDRGGISIGNDVLIGPAVQLLTINHRQEPFERSTTMCRPITIGERVWIGGGAIVLPGVTIGKCSIVSAGAVVTHDVPEGVIVAGNPAKVIKKLPEYEKRQEKEN